MASDTEEEDPFRSRQVDIRQDKKVGDLYTIKEQLGKGKFGTVYRCIENGTNKVWAAKFIKCKASEKEAVKREISIMNKLQHPKLLQCADAFETTSEIVMILELVGGGELFERVIDDDYILTEKEVIIFMRQICDGLQYMHQQQILHLDLKPENILCASKKSNKIKLIDFGLARKYDPKENLKEMVGTPEFVAPEVINFEALSLATDMWSVGVICYVLLSGLSPFMGDNDAETLTNVTIAEWDFEDEAFDEISDDAKDFIDQLLIKEKAQRQTVEQCLNHKWLRKDTNKMKAAKISTQKLKKWLARRRWQKTTNAVRAIGRMSSLKLFSSLSKSTDKPVTPFSGLLKAKREGETGEKETSAPEDEVDIDLSDPEVAKAASKIQGVFRKSRGVDTKKGKLEKQDRVDSRDQDMASVKAPIFTQDLEDVEVCEGSAARLDCVVIGSPEPDIRWLKDGLEITESRHYRMEFGDDDSCSLIIAEINEDDDGEYTCEAINNAGKADSTAEIIVEVMGSEEDESPEDVVKRTFATPTFSLAKQFATPQTQPKESSDKPPEFILRPRNLTATETKSTRFSCKVDGIPTPTVTWKFEGKVLKDEGRHEIYEDSGVHYLEVFELTVNDAGTYTCTLKSSAGEVTAKATLTVFEKEPSIPEGYEPPKFTKKITECEVIEGSAARFECKITGTPAPEVTWYKDKKELKEGKHFRMEYDGSGLCCLTVADVTANDDDVYTITAKNQLGSVSCSADLIVELESDKEEVAKAPIKKTTSLTVQRPALTQPKKELSKPEIKAPEFTLKPKAQTVAVPNTAKFTCSVAGTPKPTVKWDKNGKILEDEGRFEIYEEKGVHILEIFDTEVSDSGKYTVTTTNTAGKATATVSLNMQGKKERTEAPKFIRKVKDSTIMDGDEAIFECEITGLPTPKVHWLLDGKEIRDCDIYQISFNGKVAKLVLPEAFPEDEGDYTCKAVNSAGQVSCTAELLVEEVKKPVVTKDTKPEFVDKLQDLTVQDGDQVKLTVKIKGSPAPKVTWFMNNEPIEDSPDFRLISKDDVHTLFIAEIFPDDTGKYTCRASNTAGQSESSAKLTVKEPGPSTDPPVFIQKPKSVNVDEGNSVKLECKVEGSPIPSITWEKNGQTVYDGGRIKISNSDDTNILHIQAVLSTDAGRYTCKAENMHGQECCTVTVSVRQIEEEPIDFRSLLKTRPNLQKLNKTTVEECEGKESDIDQKDFRHMLTRHVQTKCKPEIIKGLKDLKVNEGDKAVFECHVKGVPPPEIVWALDEKDIKESKYFHMTYDGVIARLTIAEAFPEDEGEYMCRATNTVAAVESFAELIVKEEFADEIKPKSINTTSKQVGNHVNGGITTNGNARKSIAPRIVEDLEDEVVLEGSAARFECRISGDPEPEIFWFKNGKGISENRKYQFEFEGDDIVILLVQQVSTADLGNYTCRAKNSAGQVETCASLTVEGPPKILEGPQNLQAVVGQKVIMKCIFKGNPDPEVKWFKNKTELKYNRKIAIETKNDTTCLTIKKVEADDAGIYILKVENEMGSDNFSMGLSVEDKPDPPAGKPSAIDVSKTSLTLMWSGPSYDGGCIITGYLVEMCKANDRFKKWSKVTTTNCISHTVTGLIPETEYKFRVSAQNAHGWSEPGKESEAILTTEIEPQNDTEVDGRIDSDEEELAFKPRIVKVDAQRKVKEFYDMKEEVGKGKFGTVYRCIEKDTGKTWAAKFIKTRGAEKEAVRKEIAVMNELQHPKLLQCADAFESPTEMVMILEFIAGGELFERVIDDEFELTEKEVIIFMRQICEGVNHMHKQGILHLDLKPENILCASKKSNKIKLIDFGLARKYDPKENLKEMVGTPEFVAPEVINFEALSLATDMWSVGVICYVLLSGLSPFMGDNDAETLTNVTIAEWDFEDEAFDEISDDAKDFIEKLLIKGKEERNTVEQCFNHKWLLKDTKTMKAAKISTAKLKKWVARRRWQKTANAVRAIGRMASLKMFSSLSRSQSGDKPATPFSNLLKAKREEEAKKQSSGKEEEEVDIDLNDPEVAKAASKIQGVFRRTRQPKVEAGKATQNADQPKRGLLTRDKSIQSDPDEENGATRVKTKKSSPPKLEKRIRDCPVMVGDVGRFDCKVSGVPEPDIFWYQDGIEIKDGKKFEMDFEDNGTCSLIVTDVTVDDDAEYTVKAVNSAGEISCTAELIVEGDESDEEGKRSALRKRVTIKPKKRPPVFKTKIEDIVTFEGTSVKFECIVSGSPQPDVFWYYDGKLISPESEQFSMYYDENGKCTLQVEYVTVNQDGEYTCEAVNTSGKSVCYAELEVEYKDLDGKIPGTGKDTTTSPEFTQSIQHCETVLGGRVIFEARVSGEPTPSITWYRQDQLLDDDNDRITIEDNGDGLYRLIIADVEDSDIAKYTCKAVNPVGEAVCYAQLKVQYEEETQGITQQVQDQGIQSEILRDQETDFVKAVDEEISYVEAPKTDEPISETIPKTVQEAHEDTFEFQLSESTEFGREYEKPQVAQPISESQQVTIVTPTEISEKVAKTKSPEQHTATHIQYTEELSVVQSLEMAENILSTAPRERRPSFQLEGEEQAIITPSETAEIMTYISPEKEAIKERQSTAEEVRIVTPSETTEGLGSSTEIENLLQASAHEAYPLEIKPQESTVEILERKQKEIHESQQQEIQITPEETDEREPELPVGEKVTVVHTEIGEFQIVTPIESTEEVRTEISPTRKQRASAQFESEEFAFVASEETAGTFDGKAPVIERTADIAAQAAEEMELIKPAEVVGGLAPVPTPQKVHIEMKADELQVSTTPYEISANITTEQLQAQTQQVKVQAEEFRIVQPMEEVQGLLAEQVQGREHAQLRVDHQRIVAPSEMVEGLSVPDVDDKVRRQSVPQVTAEEVAIVAQLESVEGLSAEEIKEKVEHSETVTAEERRITAPTERAEGLTVERAVVTETLKGDEGETADVWRISTPMEIAAEYVSTEESARQEQTRVLANQELLAGITETVEEIDIPEDTEMISQQGPRPSIQLSELEVITPIEKVEWLLAGVEEQKVLQAVTGEEKVVVTPSEGTEDIDVRDEEKEQEIIVSTAVPTQFELVTPSETAEMQYTIKADETRAETATEGGELNVIMPTEIAGDLDVPTSAVPSERKVSVRIPQEVKLVTSSETAEVEYIPEDKTERVTQAAEGEQLTVVMASEMTGGLDTQASVLAPEHRPSVIVPQELKLVTPSETTQMQIQPGMESPAEKLTSTISVPVEMELITPSERAELQDKTEPEAIKLTKAEIGEELVLGFSSEVVEDIDVKDSAGQGEKIVTLETTAPEMEVITPSEMAELQGEFAKEAKREKTALRGDEFVVVTPSEITEDIDIADSSTDVKETGVVQTMPEEIRIITPSEIAEGMGYEENVEPTKTPIRQQGEEQVVIVPIEMMWMEAPLNLETVEPTSEDDKELEMASPLPRVIIHEGKREPTEGEKVSVVHLPAETRVVPEIVAEVAVERTAEDQIEFDFDLNDEEVVKAVVKIQSAFRGFTVRKSVKAPEFTKQLSDQEVNNGTTVRFECHVQGIPDPDIQWFKDKKVIQEGPHSVLYQDDHQCCLIIHNTTRQDDGVYTCQATNKVGSAKTSGELVVEGSGSSEYETAPSAEESVSSRDSPIEEVQKLGAWKMPMVTIGVEEVTAPELTMKLQSLVVEKGTTAKLMCGVTGIPKPTVTWFFGGRQLRNEGRYRIYDENDMYSLEISDCHYDNTGEYIITATNAEGQVYCAGDLMVQTPEGERRSSFTQPLFMQPLKDISVVANSSARFDCQVTGVPEPEILWFHDGYGIHEGDNYIMEITDEGFCSLIVVSTDKNSGGEYSCVASNAMGRSSCSCKLKIQESEEESSEDTEETTRVTRIRQVPEQIAPEFIDKPNKECHVLAGKTSRISCTVKGSPSPSVVWFKDHNPIRIDSHYQLHLIGNTRTLLIPQTAYSDAGEYTCAASNASGAVYCSTVLHVDEPESFSSGSEESGELSLSETEILPPHEPLETITEDSEEQDVEEITIKPKIVQPVALTLQSVAAVAFVQELPAVVEERVEEIKPAEAVVILKMPDSEKSAELGVPIQLEAELAKEQLLPTEQSASFPDKDKLPVFVKKIESSEVSRGTTVKFVSRVSGSPGVVVSWYKNEDELEDDDHFCMELDETRGNYCLMINDVTSDDEGRYTCMAANSYGQVACSAYLRLEGVVSSATDSEHSTSTSDAKTNDEDKRTKQTFIIGEETNYIYTVIDNYMDESGRLVLNIGDLVEVLDTCTSLPDRWCVRHRDNPTMVGYISPSLLQRESSIEKSASEALLDKLAETGDESRPGLLSDTTLKPKPPFRVPSVHRDSGGSDSSEAEDIKVTLESFEIYMAVADYTPDPSNTEDIPLVDGQYVDVLDSNSATQWLVRTKPTKSHPPRQGWVRPSLLEKKTHTQYERKERPKSREFPEMPEEFSQLERIGSKELEYMKKREYVLEELLATERQFVKDIQFAVHNHMKAMDSPTLPSVLQGKKDMIFMNLEEIVDFHSNIFVQELENCNDDAASVGRAFIKWQPKFEMHVQYCKNKQRSESFLSTPVVKSYFEEFSKTLGGDKQLSLSDYLIKPVQRITKYQLLLKEIVKYTARAKQDCADLELAVDVMLQVPKRANDLMHISLIEGFPGNVEDLGELCRKDQLIVWDSKPKGKGKDRLVYLFHSLIMFTKIKKESKLESPGYLYKSHMTLPGIGMTDDLSDDRRFELWYGKATSTSLMTLQAKTIYVKQAWVKEIRDILSRTQQELLEIKAIAERRYGKSTDSVSSGSEVSFPGKPSPIPLRKFTAAAGKSESVSSGGTTPTLTPAMSPMPLSPASGSPRPSSPAVPGIPGPETVVVGETYEVTEDVMAEGGDEVVITKGESVKVIARGSNNTYKIQTTPTDNFPTGQQGFVPEQYLRKPEPKPITEAPKWIQKPKSCTVMAGQTATFSCKYKGIPKPEIEWFIQESVLLENRMEITHTPGQSTMCIYNVKVEDAGKYKCVAENALGMVSVAVNLHVQASPTFIKTLNNATAAESTIVQLSCIIVASPEPHVTWYKDGLLIMEGGKYIQEVDQDGVCTLTVSGVCSYDYGEYSCKAVNLVGDASTSAKLTVPSEPIPEVLEDKTDEHTLDVNDFYDIKHQLARGKFCKVHLCTDSISQSNYVAKFIGYHDARRIDAQRELQTMKSLLHPSVVHHYESFESSYEMVIVMEYIPGGQLFDCIANSDMDFNEEHCAFYVKQLCRAIDYLHHEQIVHLDIEPGNILCVDKTTVDPFIIKLTDFGNARHIGDEIKELHSLLDFIAPEVIRFEGITPKSDIWSVGVIAYVLLCGISPFRGKSRFETFQNIFDARWKLTERFNELSQSCKDFLRHTLVLHASERYSGSKCLRHPWLSSRNEEITAHPLDCTDLKKFLERQVEVKYVIYCTVV
ncbi:muscle M-line assembly protein unc-89-like [Glandiceps talaboti]